MERWKNDGKNFSKNKRLKRKEKKIFIILICMCLIEEIEIVNNFLLFGWEGKKINETNNNFVLITII